jgi:hypothetical protein
MHGRVVAGHDARSNVVRAVPAKRRTN